MRKLNLEVRHRVGLNLVDAVRMAEMAKNVSTTTQELDNRRVGLFVQLGDRFDVYAEVGLPRSLMFSVVSHEFTHAWQAENCPRNQSALLREGFAEYCAYVVLLENDFTLAVRRMERRRDFYGQGLARVRRLANQAGDHALLSYLKTHI